MNVCANVQDIPKECRGAGGASLRKEVKSPVYQVLCLLALRLGPACFLPLPRRTILRQCRGPTAAVVRGQASEEVWRPDRMHQAETASMAGC